jgi:hypothetical protein
MLSKRFRFAESFRLQFHWEVIFVFNTAQFSLPPFCLAPAFFTLDTSQNGIAYRIMARAAEL